MQFIQQQTELTNKPRSQSLTKEGGLRGGQGAVTAQSLMLKSKVDLLKTYIDFLLLHSRNITYSYNTVDESLSQTSYKK